MIRAVESSADLEACARIFADVEPVDRVTVAELAAADGTLLLADGGGYAFVKRSSVAESAYAMVRVRPSARRNGIGSALLEAAALEALALGTHRLWGRVHEGDAESCRFVTVRGFHEVTRDIEILLDVAAGDGEWAPGIVELADEHLEGAYRVVAEAMPETAVPQVAAAPPFEDWVQREYRFGAMAAVALDDGRVVGYARLYRLPAHEKRLENGMTAVLRSHRRRGIATALKRAQIAWAAEHGYTEIVSDMVEGNVAMRAVNERLGYRELPAKLVVEGWPS
jgi:mycothiol synthase